MRNTQLWRWAPGVLLTLGATLTVGIDTQRSLPLRDDLADVVPGTYSGLDGADLSISEEELRVVGADAYLYRVFRTEDGTASAGAPAFSLYVGYYERQGRGYTIHSPKNCLPGSGWEALMSSTAAVPTPEGPVEVNRYLIQREDQRALVLYWYQGRGRVAHNEYRVKFDLLRDSALFGRSEEALVRVVVPIVDTTVEAAQEQATGFAAVLIPALYRALPE